jgi:hypothetical protein
MPGHPELGGDGRDSGAVDHQPPQHISGPAAGRGRPRDCQRAQVLVEHRTATLWGQTAVTGHGHPQHQRIAGDRQIGQRPGHGVAVSAFGPAVRAPRIPGHRTAEDRRLLLVDGSVGDRHTQHPRVFGSRGKCLLTDREAPKSGTRFADCKSVGLRLQWFESTTCHAAQTRALACGTPMATLTTSSPARVRHRISASPTHGLAANGGRCSKSRDDRCSDRPMPEVRGLIQGGIGATINAMPRPALIGRRS